MPLQGYTQYLQWGKWRRRVKLISKRWVEPYWTTHQCISYDPIWQETQFGSHLLYIIFVKFFLPTIPTFRFRSWRYFISCWLFFHMLHFPHLYLFFPYALALFTTFSELLWHFIFLCFIFVTLPIHPDAVYKPMYLSSSSSVCKLTLILLLSYSLSKFPLSSQSSL